LPPYRRTVRPLDLDELTPADKAVAGSGIVLVVDLAFLPWQSIDLGLATFTRSAVESPYRLPAVLAVLVTIAVVAVTLLRSLRPEVALTPPLAWAGSTGAGSAAVLVLLAAKMLLEPAALGIGAWLGILLAATMVAGSCLGLRAEPAVSRPAPRRSGRGAPTG
jgi:hypothetical protein